MNELVIKKLNQLNQDFYTKIAADFSATRQQAWAGWEELLPIITENWPQAAQLSIHDSQLSVLDIGCGNGRFGQFLKQNLTQEISYCGVDNNQTLLDEAKTSLKPLISSNTLHLIKADILTFLPEKKADLICLFGVLHHIPSFSLRAQLLQKLSQQLNPGGLLIFTAWQFDQLPNVFHRQKTAEDIGLRANDLEENDYLLTWERGPSAIRYCHLLKSPEINQLIAGTHLQEKSRYLADGPQQNANLYLILQRQ